MEHLDCRPIYASKAVFGQLTGLSPRTIDRLVKAGVLCTIKLGTRRLVKVDESVKAIEEHAQQGGVIPGES